MHTAEKEKLISPFSGKRDQRTARLVESNAVFSLFIGFTAEEAWSTQLRSGWRGQETETNPFLTRFSSQLCVVNFP